MDKELAIYLTTLIANDLEQIRDISSYALEQIEKCFINGKFEFIKEYIYNFKKDTRNISDIIKESD